MADIVLNRLLNAEIPIYLLTKWLIHDKQEVTKENKDFNCTQGDFISYFLNCIHEEAPCDFANETPRKKTSIDLDNSFNFSRRQNLFSGESNSKACSLNKSSTFPPLKTTFSCGSASGSNCSTPISKSGSGVIELNEQSIYNSSISPLYRNEVVFSTPKNQKSWSSRKSSDKNNLCLGDFIVNTKKSSSKKKVQKSLAIDHADSNADIKCKFRRINPTNVNQKQLCANFGKSDNSFDFKNGFIELDVKDTSKQRNLLTEEKMKIETRVNLVSCPQVVTPRKFRLSDKGEIVPDLASVTCKDSLDISVALYVFLLENNLVLNLTSEFHFLMSLLLSRQYKSENSCSDSDVSQGIDILNESDLSEQKIDDLRDVLRSSEQLSVKTIFRTIHNVIYFCVRTLEKQVNILHVLDKATLKLLAENKNIKTFSPNLHEQLALLHSRREDCRGITENHLFDEMNVNVCFISDTDNRENFPSDQSFHAFRRQRDLFYEILRIWEKNHLLSGWNFNTALSGKIRSLLSLHDCAVNFMHLARLFKGQLLTSCGKNHNYEEGISENQLPFLSSIPNCDLEKLNRLKSRLVTKQSNNSINASPVFTGQQEFYRDFIITSANHVFIKHITDSFISELYELNDTKFGTAELDEIGNTADAVMQKSFLYCIKSLRILAKFLGFLESLPYKTDLGQSENITLAQISVRQKTHPVLDLAQIISAATRKQTLTITVPWVTKYLSMLDHVTLRLPYYTKICEMLFRIYQNCSKTFQRNPEGQMLVKLCLGWLFELSHFPEGSYFNYCSVNLRQSQTDSDKVENYRRGCSLDELRLVDQQVLYVCCPYLKEIKKILISNSSNNDNTTVKHITPLTALQSPNKMAKKRVEIQLEEAFFNGQPVSVKKTVEFVSERVASTCVKHICNIVVPNYKKTVLDEWKVILNNLRSTINEEQASKQLNAKSNEFALQSLMKLKEICHREVNAIVKDKITASISGLLPLDVLQQTKNACTSIATRMCVERIEEWTNSHLILGIFTKDFESEINRLLHNKTKKSKEKTIFRLPQEGRNVSHNSNTLSAVHLLETIREFIWNVLEHSEDVTLKNLTRLLEESAKTISQRSDVNDCIINEINKVLLDLALLLIAHCPSLIAEEKVYEQFLNSWKHYVGDSNVLFKSLVCSRNVELFSQSKNVTVTWEGFANFVAFLLRDNMLSCENVEEQCVGIFRQDWNRDTLKHLTNSFDALIKCYLNYDGCTSKFTLLIDFLSEFCSDVHF